MCQIFKGRCWIFPASPYFSLTQAGRHVVQDNMTLLEKSPEVLLVFVCGEDAFGVDVSLDTVSGHLEVLVLSKLEVLEEGSREEFLVDERETVLSVLLEVGEPVEWK